MSISVFSGREQETFLEIDLTGSPGRTLTAVEATAKTIRFTGTLGASVVMRLPLRPAGREGPGSAGYSGTFENQTLGGYAVEVAPITGGSIEIPSGAAITCFYDGADMIGQGTLSASGFPVDNGGVISFVPIVVTDPVIGDAVTYVPTPDPHFENLPPGFPGTVGGVPTGFPIIITDPENGDTIIWVDDHFENVPGGAATMAIGSMVSGGTEGSVLFIDASGQLGQDNARFFWDAGNIRLGIGTSAPVGTLHVLDNTNATLARFHGEDLFSSVFLELGDGGPQAALRIYPGIAASGGAPLVESGGLLLRAHYWSGAASLPVDAGWVTHVTDDTPTYYLAGQVAGVDRIHIRQDGQTTLGSSTPNTDADIAEAVYVGGGLRVMDAILVPDSGAYAGQTLIGDVSAWDPPGFPILNGIRYDFQTHSLYLSTPAADMASFDVQVDNSFGVRWGTGASAKQSWWGADPTTQATSPTGTDTEKIDGLIAIMEGYGLLGL